MCAKHRSCSASVFIIRPVTTSNGQDNSNICKLPKSRTVCAILFGLLPIMSSPALQAGADVMKRIAAPMIGGIVTSGILELLIYPVIYVIWRKRELPDQTEEEVPFIPPEIWTGLKSRS